MAITRTQVTTLLTYLAGAYPGKLKFPSGNKTSDDAMIMAYRRALTGYSAEVVTAAANKYIDQGGEWPPNAGQLAVEAGKIANPEQALTGLEAWAELQGAIARHSPYYEYSEFMAALSPPVREVVRAIGWDTIDRTDPAFMQGRFVKAFDNQQAASRERKALAQITAGERLQLGTSNISS